jgi:hypothetical protein
VPSGAFSFIGLTSHNVKRSAICFCCLLCVWTPLFYFSQETAISPAVGSIKPQASIKPTRIGEKERANSKQNTEQNIVEPNVGKVLDPSRVAQLRHLCNEGMLLTQRIPRNDVVVEPSTLKAFIRKANLWQAEHNTKSEGGPELSPQTPRVYRLWRL